MENAGFTTSQKYRLITSAMAAIIASSGVIVTTTSVVMWVLHPNTFAVYDGLIMLCIGVFICFLGLLFGILPWNNKSDTPKLARIILTLSGSVNVLFGLGLVGWITSVWFFDPNTFFVYDGFWVLAGTFLHVCTGAFACNFAWTSPENLISNH